MSKRKGREFKWFAKIHLVSYQVIQTPCFFHHTMLSQRVKVGVCKFFDYTSQWTWSLMNYESWTLSSGNSSHEMFQDKIWVGRALTVQYLHIWSSLMCPALLTPLWQIQWTLFSLWTHAVLNIILIVICSWGFLSRTVHIPEDACDLTQLLSRPRESSKAAELCL